VAAAAACSGEGRLGRLGEQGGELGERQGRVEERRWGSGEAPAAARFAAGEGLRVGEWAAAPL
jgi:hypothetical protein